MVKMKNFSQTGEQLKLIKIFEIIGIQFHKCLEFGADDGKLFSNTRHFIEQLNFNGVLWDIKPRANGVFQESVTAENINELFIKYGLDKGIDLLSIDVDGNDYWIWKALEYKPRVVIIEYNGSIEPDESITIEYKPDFVFDSTSYYGASWKALLKLGQEKGYELVDSTSLNMIFVLKTEITCDLVYGNLAYQPKKSFPSDKLLRKWIEV